MKKLFYLLPLLVLIACGNTVVEKVEQTYPDNAKKLVRFYQLDNDKEVLVEEKQYHQNGALKMGGNFLNGKREGEWKAFFDNKQLQSEGTFKKGIRIGKAKVYYPNGVVRYEGAYENDKEVGVWKFYDEDGKLLKEEEF
ncbi:MAG: toxin-antitoxin system YwqK family antitoxin [Vicingaceae bacterium]